MLANDEIIFSLFTNERNIGD